MTRTCSQVPAWSIQCMLSMDPVSTVNYEGCNVHWGQGASCKGADVLPIHFVQGMTDRMRLG